MEVVFVLSYQTGAREQFEWIRENKAIISGSVAEIYLERCQTLNQFLVCVIT